MVKIEPFHPIGEDQRGITAEIHLPRKQSTFMYLTRKANSLSGNTYHEGKNEATAPKIFLLLTGEIRFSYRKIGETTHTSKVISAPAKIEVSPLITHSVEVLQDAVMLECNALADILEDRIKASVKCEESANG